MGRRHIVLLKFSAKCSCPVCVFKSVSMCIMWFIVVLLKVGLCVYLSLWVSGCKWWSLSATAICATSLSSTSSPLSSPPTMSIPSLSYSSSPAVETKSRQTDHLPQAPGMVFESSYCYIVQCPNPPPVTVLQCYSVKPPAWFSNAQFFSILGIPLPDPPQLEKQHAIMIRNMIIRIFYLELFQSWNPSKLKIITTYTNLR